jgi:hypothetical protein
VPHLDPIACAYATTREDARAAAVRAAPGARPDVVGWFGASAIERLAIERAADA